MFKRSYLLAKIELLKFKRREKKKFFAHFVTSTFIFCRRCKMIFSSTNQLHSHLRFNYRQNWNFFANDFKFLTTQFTYSTKIFFIVVIKITFISSSKFSIINFDVDVFKNLDIEYEFRDWIYVKHKIIFTKKNISNDVCFDIKTKIIFANSNFFRRQNFDILIR